MLRARLALRESDSSADLFDIAEAERGLSSSLVRERPRSLSSVVLRLSESAERPPIMEVNDLRPNAPDERDDCAGGGEGATSWDVVRSRAFMMMLAASWSSCFFDIMLFVLNRRPGVDGLLAPVLYAEGYGESPRAEEEEERVKGSPPPPGECVDGAGL